MVTIAVGILVVGLGAWLVRKTLQEWQSMTRRRLGLLARRAAELQEDVKSLGLVVPVPDDPLDSVRVEGEVQGVTVTLVAPITEFEPSENSISSERAPGVLVMTMLSEPLHALLQIDAQGTVGLAMEEWTGRGDLQCGAPDLDHTFSFASTSPRLATAVLRQASFQAGLRTALRLRRGLTLRLHNRRQQVTVNAGSPVAPVIRDLVESVRQREAALETVLATACGLPGFAVQADATTTAYAGELEGAQLVVRHDAASDGVQVIARPCTPLQSELYIQCRDRAELAPGRVPVPTGDLIIDRVLTVALPEETPLHLHLAQDGIRERLVGFLKEQPHARVEDGAVRLVVPSFDPKTVETLAREAALVAVALGAAVRD